MKRAWTLQGSKHASTRWDPTKGITLSEFTLMSRALPDWYFYRRLAEHALISASTPLMARSSLVATDIKFTTLTCDLKFSYR